jgi:hypothetical protein
MVARVPVVAPPCAVFFGAYAAFVALLVGAFAAPARAQTLVPLIGGDFENPAVGPGAFAVAGPPPGWSDYGAIDHGARSTGVLNPASTTLYGTPPPGGAQVGVVFLWNTPGAAFSFAGVEAGLEQTLSAVLTPGRRYDLSVAIGDIAPYPPHGFPFAGFPGYRIELLAGGVVLAADETSASPPEGGFATASLRFDLSGPHPQAGAALGIRLVNRDAGPGLEVNFDQVSLTETPIAVWSILGFGLGGAGGVPSLTGEGAFLSGEEVRMTLGGAPPSSSVAFVFGFETLYAPLFAGTLIPAPALVLEAASDGFGVAQLSFLSAAPWPAGLSIYAQGFALHATAPQGLAMSAGLQAALP